MLSIEIWKTSIIDRKISDEEVNQYYQDFIIEFTEPETRDISYVFVDNNSLAQTYKPTEEEIKTYEAILQPEETNDDGMDYDALCEVLGLSRYA